MKIITPKEVSEILIIRVLRPSCLLTITSPGVTIMINKKAACIVFFLAGTARSAYQSKIIPSWTPNREDKNYFSVCSLLLNRYAKSPDHKDLLRIVINACLDKKGLIKSLSVINDPYN